MPYKLSKLGDVSGIKGHLLAKTFKFNPINVFRKQTYMVESHKENLLECQ